MKIVPLIQIIVLTALLIFNGWMLRTNAKTLRKIRGVQTEVDEAMAAGKVIGLVNEIVITLDGMPMADMQAPTGSHADVWIDNKRHKALINIVSPDAKQAALN